MVLILGGCGASYEKAEVAYEIAGRDGKRYKVIVNLR